MLLLRRNRPHEGGLLDARHVLHVAQVVQLVRQGAVGRRGKPEMMKMNFGRVEGFLISKVEHSCNVSK